ncbi:MAG TPA: flavodoxin [Candidatus Scybalocola faecigallinarum]|uniref:Flavodoxin n=1 Tax=Candidatus Scybalocola faecigallinarum TaxID=2840941 RepID=A0A9D1F4W0_9FIRM|nr:flavodoxin [Candidatus Scybalocola faecigallinarum]
MKKGGIMKKLLSLGMALVLALSLMACGQSAAGTGQSASDSAGDTVSAAESESDGSGESLGTSGSNVLVAYFSWSGNTQEMAFYIAQQTGADLYEIVPETPYPEDYNECGDVALAERDNNERPAIAGLPDSLDQYDTIIIGYPIWWHTAPMIIGTFLESYDLTGKDVYPFTQSASMNTEQFDNSIDFVRESAGSGQVHDGLFARPSDTETIDAYLSDNGLTL